MLAALVICADLLQVPVVTQSTPYTCGPAALTSVLRFYGVECWESYVARAVKAEPTHGTQPGALRRYARSKGLRAESHRKMQYAALRRHIADGRPVIVSFRWPNGGGHYVTVIGCTRTHTTYLDPHDGKTVELSRTHFCSLWDRWGLILRPAKARGR